MGCVHFLLVLRAIFTVPKYPNKAKLVKPTLTSAPLKATKRIDNNYVVKKAATIPALPTSTSLVSKTAKL